MFRGDVKTVFDVESLKPSKTNCLIVTVFLLVPSPYEKKMPLSDETSDCLDTVGVLARF
jgi:hypothetical protein